MPAGGATRPRSETEIREEAFGLMDPLHAMIGRGRIPGD
jgi:hypothetical protein